MIFKIFSKLKRQLASLILAKYNCVFVFWNEYETQSISIGKKVLMVTAAQTSLCDRFSTLLIK